MPRARATNSALQELEADEANHAEARRCSAEAVGVVADHDGGRRSSRAATCAGVQLPPCIVATPRAARARAIALSIALLLMAASGGFRARISRWISRMIGKTVAA